MLAAEPDIEVILVDNGSSDDTPVVLAEFVGSVAGLRSVRVPVNKGYGFGVLSGLAEARGDVLGWTHADLQTDPMDVVRAIALFRAAPSSEGLFVKGRRYGRPLSDRLFTIGMSIFETLLMGCPLNDINAQPNLFSRRFYESWRDAPHDFSLDLYVYVSARRAGLSIRRFPVLFAERAHGTSHWNINWRSKIKFIRRTLDFSLKLRMKP